MRLSSQMGGKKGGVGVFEILLIQRCAKKESSQGKKKQRYPVHGRKGSLVDPRSEFRKGSSQKVEKGVGGVFLFRWKSAVFSFSEADRRETAGR